MASMESLREVAEAVVSALRGLVDEYIVSVSRSRSVMVKLARGQVSVVQSWSDLNVSVYATRGGRIMAASFKAHTAVEAAKETVRLVERLEPSKLYAPLPEATAKAEDNFDPELDKVAGGYFEAIVADVGLEGDIGDVSGMVEAGSSTVVVLGSNGADFESRHTGFKGYFRVFRGRASGEWGFTSSRFEPELARMALEKATGLAEECASLPKGEVRPGVYRLLLSPMVAGNLFERVADAALAGSVIMGFSFLADAKPGDAVASEKVTLVSAPRDRSLPGFSSYDDEGVPTRDVAFIERGEFKTLLHNTKTARLLGGETTGNAGLIFPRLFNLRLEPGGLKGEDDALEALSEGIYATNNWYTRFQNYVESTFSTVLRDAVFVVRGGRPRECVRGQRLRISGSLRGLLRGVEELGAKQERIEWWDVETPFKLPMVLVDSESGLEVRPGGIPGLEY